MVNHSRKTWQRFEMIWVVSSWLNHRSKMLKPEIDHHSPLSAQPVVTQPSCNNGSFGINTAAVMGPRCAWRTWCMWRFSRSHTTNSPAAAIWLKWSEMCPTYFEKLWPNYNRWDGVKDVQLWQVGPLHSWQGIQCLSSNIQVESQQVDANQPDSQLNADPMTAPHFITFRLFDNNRQKQRQQSPRPPTPRSRTTSTTT